MATNPNWLQQVQQFGNLSNLPPELWAQLQGPNPSAVVYDGYRINPILGNAGGGGENNYTGQQQVQSYAVTPSDYSTTPGDNIGKSNALFNPDGSYGGTSQITGFDSSDSFGHWLTLMAAAAAAGYGASAMAGVGAGAGGAAEAGGAGAAGGGGASLGTNGAFLGEGVASGVPAWDAAATNAGLSLTGGGAAGAGSQFNINGAGGDGASYDATTGGYGDGGSVSSTADGNPYATDLNSVNGSDVMSDAFDANGAHGAGGFGGSNGTWWSALANAMGGSNSGYGRLITSLLGGAMGSHGVQTSSTTQRTIDPRMVPYVYGDANNPGILQRTQGLLSQQFAPGAMQGYTDMQNVGRGLLNQPVAGNGFNRFFGGR
jgi:hypothetical protein